jgi:hypothetical protein
VVINNPTQTKVLRPKDTDNNSTNPLHPKAILHPLCRINSTAVILSKAMASSRPKASMARHHQISTAHPKVNMALHPHHMVMLLPLDSISNHRPVNTVRLQDPLQDNMAHHRRANTAPRHQANTALLHQANMELLHQANMELLHRANMVHPNRVVMVARQPSRLSVMANRQPTLT